MSALQQNWRRGQNRFCLEERGWGERERPVDRGQGGEMAQTMYSHMNFLKSQYVNRCVLLNPNLDA
jgi:hypothetical protein